MSNTRMDKRMQTISGRHPVDRKIATPDRFSYWVIGYTGETGVVTVCQEQLRFQLLGNWLYW